MSAESKVVRIGLLGFGTVGEGTYRMLADNAEAVRRKTGLTMEVTRIAVKDSNKERSVAQQVFTLDPFELVNDPLIDVVVEAIGGEHPSAELVEQALLNGKHVVTANKELMAKHGSRLVNLARQRSLDLHYEAAVGGGIPLVQPIKHQLAGNDVLKMMGILNGTTNYILTQMFEQGKGFQDALSEAQAHGYAEADPTNDVDGFDTMYKIAVLSAIAFGGQVPLDAVHREGIRNIGKADMEYADRLGFRIKLLGISEEVKPGIIRVRVHPTMIPKDHSLANVNDVFNAVWLHGDFVGDIMFSGRGAGANPTASAVVGDLVDIGRNIAGGGSGSAIPYGEHIETTDIGGLHTRYYIRMTVLDRPNTLGAVSTLFGDWRVSLAGMEMRTLGPGEGEMVFLTHLCCEEDLQRAVQAIRNLKSVIRVDNVIRVEAGNGFGASVE